jgi:ABC-type lipoprotein release transport system permease subunit
MPALIVVLKALLLAAAAAALAVLVTNWPSRLDWSVAMRYLRSRRSSRLLSLITVIAVGGVTVGVMALVIVLGVMNGLQNDLRENPRRIRICVATTAGLQLDDWSDVLAKCGAREGGRGRAVRADEGLISAGHDFAEGVIIGISRYRHARGHEFARYFTKVI